MKLNIHLDGTLQINLDSAEKLRFRVEKNTHESLNNLKLFVKSIAKWLKLRNT